VPDTSCCFALAGCHDRIWAAAATRVILFGVLLEQRAFANISRSPAVRSDPIVLTTSLTGERSIWGGGTDTLTLTTRRAQHQGGEL